MTRLRGFRSGRRLVAVFAEPVLSVALGSLGGYLLATLVAQAVASTTAFTVVQPFEVLPLVIGALTAVGSLVALVLASVRSATLPLAQLLRERSEPRRINRAALVAQSGIVLATALVVYSVLTGGAVTGPQLPLLAPALIAATVGLLGVRVAVPLLRRRLAPLPRTLTGLLVVRRVIRTPSLLATAVVVCVAVALTTAATQTLVTSDGLQRARAEAVVGASRVLDVRAPVGSDLVAAVRRADPTGRLAMAAVDLDDGAGIQHVVAVDTARLEAVSSWHPTWAGMSPTRVRRLLAPTEGRSLRIVGRRVEVDLADTSLPPSPSGVFITLHDLELSMIVQTDTAYQTVVLGKLSGSRFTASLPCASGCRIVGLTIVNVGGDNGGFAVDTRIARIRTDLQSATETAALLHPALWRQQIDTSTALDDPPKVRIAQGSEGLALSLTTQESRAVLGIVPRDTPQPVPVLIGPQVQLQDIEGIPGAELGSGLDFDYILVRAVGRAQILPRARGDGVLADLGVLQKVSDPAAVQGRSQVWLSAAAGPAVVRALERQGLRVIGSQRQSDVERGFLGETIPRVALQGAVVGVTGLLLALFALLVSGLMRRPATRTTAELLRIAGGSRSAVRRIAFLEAAAPPIAGAVLGGLAGVVGARLILPTLPLGTGAGFLPPLDLTISAAAAIVPAAAAVVVSMIIAAATIPRGER